MQSLADPPFAVVATDLDGTLLPTWKVPSDFTIGVLRHLTDAGVHLVFVTGRPIRWMHHVVETTGHRGLAVCSNGGVVLDLHSMEVLHHSAVPPASVRELIEALAASVPEVAFAVETPLTFVTQSGFPNHPDDPGPVATVNEAVELAGVDDIVKLLAKHPSSTGDELLEACRQALEDAGLTGVAELTISGAAGLVEIAAPGVSKAATLAQICATRWDVGAERVVAFGDMPNDVPMLQWAGTSFAMPNGHPDAIGAATHTAAFTSDENGVARELVRLFALPHDEASALT